MRLPSRFRSLWYREPQTQTDRANRLSNLARQGLTAGAAAGVVNLDGWAEKAQIPVFNLHTFGADAETWVARFLEIDSRPPRALA